MSEFPEYLRSAARSALSGLGGVGAAGVYVVSFYISSYEDDPRRTTLTVGTNTESQVRKAMTPGDDSVKPNRWWTPVHEQEARWNFAFWQQNELAVIGRDPTGARLRRSWFEDLGLWFDDDESEESDEITDRMIQTFVGLCVATARWLHSSGTIESVFGREIPVIVHELEYYEEIAIQNVEANGAELAGGLVEWISSM